VRLDHVQRERRGHCRVEGVAAAFEHRHARGRGQVMRTRDHPEGPREFWAGGEYIRRRHAADDNRVIHGR